MAKNDEMLRYNRQHDWVNRCIDVLVRLTRVLRDVHITPMLSSGMRPFPPSRNSLCNGCTLIQLVGTLLGWYRHCSVTEATNDLDLDVDIEDIINDEHYDLLEVISPI